MKPKISILLAAYKSENVISNSLNHLLNEIDYPNYEVLVAIDGTDKTIDIARKFKKKHKNLIIDYSKRRRGKTRALNSILRKSKGEIVFIFDSGWKFFHRDALKKIAKYFENSNVGALLFNPKTTRKINLLLIRSRINYAQEFVSRIVNDWKRDKFPVIKGYFPYPLWCHVFRKHIITSLDPNIINDDAEFAYITLDKGYEIYFAEDITYYSLEDPRNIEESFARLRRTTVGWLKVKKEKKLKIYQYYFSLFLYLLFNFYKYSIYNIVSLVYWFPIYFISFITAYERYRTASITEIWVKP